MDQVDLIARQWAMERPDVDAEPLDVTSRILLLGQMLVDNCDAALADLGLTLWQYDVLAALRRAGKPYSLSPTELARVVTLSTAAMTNRLDRLEAKGWIERRADAKDRRSLRIHLTPDARKLVDRALPVRIEADRRTIAALPKRARRELVGLLRQVLQSDGRKSTRSPTRR